MFIVSFANVKSSKKKNLALLVRDTIHPEAQLFRPSASGTHCLFLEAIAYARQLSRSDTDTLSIATHF
jgi:hypothetical protein